MFLESEKIIIRDAEIRDASFYFQLFNDKDWIKYISDKGLKSVQETEKYLKDILAKNSKTNGLGFFTVILKKTNEPIGVSTILQRETIEFIDIGYGFLPKGRGKGLATEATKLIIEYVHSKYQQEKVLAFTKPDNEKSQKLLLNIGFKYICMKAIFGDDEDAVFEYIL